MEQAPEVPKRLNVFAWMGARLNRRRRFADYGIRLARALDESCKAGNSDELDEGGVSSTLRLLDSITDVSGILDPPTLVELRRTSRPLEPVIGLAEGETRWRTMTTEYEFACSRRDAPEVCWKSCPSKTEGAGNAGCTLHPRSRVQRCTKRNAHEHTGTDGAIRHSLRNGFTAYAVLSPVSEFVLSPSSADHWLVNPVGLISPPRTWHQQRVSGPHGFAVRKYAVRPARREQLTDDPPCDSPCAPARSRPPHPVPRS
jgi:hypothetical protein